MSSTVTYILKNKNNRILFTGYDPAQRLFTSVSPVQNPHLAPPAILDKHGCTNRALLNEWWHDRAVPLSRKPTSAALDDLIQNLGLSLTDCFWMDTQEEHAWEEVSLFENPENTDFSPNTSVGGDLPKKWVWCNNTWFLEKWGSEPFYQEPWNEAVASALFGIVLSPDDYVKYAMKNSRSVCPNMLARNEELIPAWDLLKNSKKPNHKNPMQHLKDTLAQTGIPAKQVDTFLEKMFVCDVILANRDRHYNNFGVVRDADSGTYLRMAPIYDTGSCLWNDKPVLRYGAHYTYLTKPFGVNPDALLSYFSDFSWMDTDRLNDFPQTAYNILRDCLPNDRLQAVLNGLSKNLETVTEYAGLVKNR